jgi:hypothetical protein
VKKLRERATRAREAGHYTTVDFLCALIFRMEAEIIILEREHADLTTTEPSQDQDRIQRE